MPEHEVVMAGGGPAGMMLAAELALAGVDVAVVERRPDHVLVGSRAGGFHARTIEVLDQRGVADRFLAEGQVAQAAMIGTTVLDMSDFPTRHPYSLGIWQNRIERVMADWIAELPVTVLYGQEVTGFAQGGDRVDVDLSGGGSLRAQYLVGCDGGRSVVRKAAGIGFPGWDPTRSNLIAEVEVTEETPPGIRTDAVGIHGLHRKEDGRTVRVVVTEREIGPSTEPTLRDLSEALVAVFGTDFGIHSPTWISRFTDATRQAASYREGTGPAGRRRGPCALSGRWPGPQPRRPGRGEPGVEARPGGRRDLGGGTAGHLSGRATSGGRPCAAALDGPGLLQRGDDRSRALVEMVAALATMDEPRDGWPGSSPGWTSTTTSARAIPCSGAACPTWTSSPTTVRCGCSPCCTTPNRCCSTSVRPSTRTSPRGPTGSGWSRQRCRTVGAPGPRCGRRPRCRPDPTRRLRRLGGGGR